MVAKVAGGIIGLGLIGTGSVAMAKPEWFGINKEVSWTPLAQDKNYSETGTNPPYKDKFGSEYKNYLTGATGKENKKNDSWWEESLKRLKKDKEASADLGNGFKEIIDKAVKPSGETGSGKYLNEICDTIYKLSKDKVKSNPDSTKNDEYKDVDVWKYCSPVGAVPKKVSEQTGEISGDNTSSWIGKTKEGELLSIKHPNNQELWKLKNDEFFGRGVFKSATSRTFDNNDKFFKSLFDQKNSNTNTDALKNKCEEAYKLTSETTPSDENKTNDAHVVKYCSLKSIQ